MDKGKVAEILVEIGTLLELKGENPFKTRAYGNAARALENLTEPLDKIIAEQRLGEVAGIGHGAGHHREPQVLRRAEGVDPPGPRRDAANSRPRPQEGQGDARQARP
jgi:hypothetical protein